MMSLEVNEEEFDKLEQGKNGPIGEKELENGQEQEDRNEREPKEELLDESNPPLDNAKDPPLDNDKDASTFTQNTHDDSLRHGHVYPVPIDLLNPPRTRREQFRDFVLRFLDRPEIQILGIIVMIAVVADGALFFFFLMGWQRLCDDPSKTDCSPRNEIYNLSIQVLCWLFTYMATVSMPWRCANTVQVFGCGKRKNSKGLDLYGRPTNDVWFHISLWNRRGILICLMLNCLLQYCNQATRLIFYNYELQDVPPGSFWVNIFFGLSFLFGAIGALWSTICAEKIRKQYPCGRFGPGLMTKVKKYCGLACRYLLCRSFQEEPTEVGLSTYEAEARHAEEEDDEDDPTHYPINILGVQRAGLRLFAM